MPRLDLALVPAYREPEGQQVNGFNVLVGGKQGRRFSARNAPGRVRAASAGAWKSPAFPRLRQPGKPTRSALRFVEDRGITGRATLGGDSATLLASRFAKPTTSTIWGSAPAQSEELETEFRPSGCSFRLAHHQRRCGPALNWPTLWRRRNAVTVGQTSLSPTCRSTGLALTEEPILAELPLDPGPIMRPGGCTGRTIVTWRSSRRRAGRSVACRWRNGPLGANQTAHHALVWLLGRLRPTPSRDDRAAGCQSRNLDRSSTRRTSAWAANRPQPVIASDLLTDVPCEQFGKRGSEPLLSYLPR